MVHHYTAQTRWEGTTADGYEAYSRAHTGAAAPSETQLNLSSDPAFRGDPAALNPEQLIVLAASSCQMLAFLAVAARARLDVRSYVDKAEGEMPDQKGPMSITRIVLRPRIQLKSGPTEERVRHLIGVAHHECYIANSLRTEIVIEPVISFV